MLSKPFYRFKCKPAANWSHLSATSIIIDEMFRFQHRQSNFAIFLFKSFLVQTAHSRNCRFGPIVEFAQNSIKKRMFRRSMFLCLQSRCQWFHLVLKSDLISKVQSLYSHWLLVSQNFAIKVSKVLAIFSIFLLT